MRNFFVFLLFCFSLNSFAQINMLEQDSNTKTDSTRRFNVGQNINKEKKPPIDLYKIYNLERDTTFLDTIFLDYFLLLMKDIPTIR
jgi:hypothetical protein